ncbi:MAG: peptide chain release factor N(5)-glutamine methyltransferase, partial [Saprospiraceae bacterium]|nr:peptide chain release factor N(5)-glutamine methyltransferase [Saprospiraceae bacterium]
YVAPDERARMDPSVVRYEPSLALWHEGDDPLIFYRRIASGAREVLNPRGAVYVELNEYRMPEIREMFVTADYQVEVRKDMQGKWRMLKAWMG